MWLIGSLSQRRFHETRNQPFHHDLMVQQTLRPTAGVRNPGGAHIDSALMIQTREHVLIVNWSILRHFSRTTCRTDDLPHPDSAACQQSAGSPRPVAAPTARIDSGRAPQLAPGDDADILLEF